MNWVSMLNDGITDSGILFILVLIDTTLSMSYQIKSGNKLLSNKLLSGLLRNFILCFMPALVHLLAVYHPRTDNIYQMISAVLAVYIGYAIVQSVLAYTDLLGIKYPDWVKNWLKTEIDDKKDKSNSNKDGSNNKQ